MPDVIDTSTGQVLLAFYAFIVTGGMFIGAFIVVEVRSWLHNRDHTAQSFRESFDVADNQTAEIYRYQPQHEPAPPPSYWAGRARKAIER